MDPAVSSGQRVPLAERALTARIRLRLREQRLARDPPWRQTGEYGDGSACAACGMSIRTAQAGIEVDFAPGTAQPPAHFHRPCFDAWQHERQRPETLEAGDPCFK